jgi:Cu+-exporting ATPase
MSTDPVCGMEVHETTAPASAEYEGETYYFCSQTCLEAFQEDPDKFVEDNTDRLEDIA